jgi:hypothetical protein
LTYGDSVPGEPHVIWRRIGTHEIFNTIIELAFSAWEAESAVVIACWSLILARISAKIFQLDTKRVEG